MSKRFLTMSLAAVMAAGIMTLPVTQSALADGETVMTLDTEYDVSITDSEWVSFSFTPEETGKYVFTSYDLVSGDPYARLYDEDGSQLTSNDDGGDGLNFLISYTLEAGETYYFSAEALDETAEYTVKLFESKTIESISTDSLPATEFEFFDTISMSGTELNVTYTDGSTSSLTMGSYSVYDLESVGYIYYTIYDGEDEVGWGESELPAGTYSVYFYSDDAWSEAYTITVNELTSATELQLDASYDVSVSEDDYVWFTYTPETSGKYALTSSDLSGDGDPYARLYSDEYYYCISADGWSAGDNNFMLVYELEAGETYYYKVLCYDYDDGTSADYSVSFYECKTIDSIAVTSLAAEEFEVYSTVSLNGTELEITYTDGSTSSFTLDSNWKTDTNSGSSIYYYIYDENGDWVSNGYYELEKGTYTVVFYASDVQTEASITVTMPASTELALNTEYDVDVTSGENVWFSFTPAETGRYLFESNDFSGEYPYVYLYDDEERLSFSSFGKNDGNFALAYKLEAGVTYYYAVSCYDWDISDTSSSSFTVYLSQLNEIKSISATSLPATEYEFFDLVTMYGAELEVTYTDGTTASLTMEDWDAYDSETLAYIYYSIYDEEENEVSEGYDYLPDGTYTVVFYTDDVRSAAYTITVNELTSCTTLTLDKDYSVSVTSDTAVWYSFTPETTGKYAFASSDLTEGNPYVYLFSEDEYLRSNSSSGEGNNFLLYRTLTAGETYYYKVSCYDDDDLTSADFTVRLYECKEIESIAVSSLVADTFDMYDTVSMDGTVLTITYTDGTTSSFTVDGNWQYDPLSCEEIYYYMCDEDGNWVSSGYEELPVGTYTVVFYDWNQDIQTDEYTITVTTPSNCIELELEATYNVNIANGEHVWYSFTPETTGVYYFSSLDVIKGSPRLYLYDSEGMLTGYSSSLSYELEAGTTYYFKATHSTYNTYNRVKYSVCLYQLKTIESISVVSLAQDEFDCYSYVSMSGTELEITYTDGTTSTLTMGSYSAYDMFSQKYIYRNAIYNAEGEQVYNSYLAAGTYTIDFYTYNYVYNEENGYYEYEYIYSDAYPFTVNEFSYDYTELELDVDYSAKVTYGDNLWYAYTPEETATYVFESSDLTGNVPYVYLFGESGYVSSNSYSGEDNNFLIYYTLEKGKTYYYMVSCYSGSSETTSKFTVRLSKASTLTGISIKSLAEEHFAWFYGAHMYGSVLEMTYEDGSTSELMLTGYSYTLDTNSYKNVWYQIYDESGDIVYDSYMYYNYYGYSTLSEGTYTVKFFTFDKCEYSDEEGAYVYSNPMYSNAYTITVGDPDVYAELKLDTDYDLSISYGETVWFTYTPEETGDYVFGSSNRTGSIPYVYIYTSDGTYCTSNNRGGSDSNFLTSYTLEAGVTYYFRTACYSYYYDDGNTYTESYSSEFTVRLYEKKTLDSFVISSVPDYVFGDYITFAGTTLTMTYTDGSTYDFVLESSGIADPKSVTYIYYSIYDEDGYSVYNRFLGLGKYTVKFYYYDEDYNRVVGAEYTFTLGLPSSYTVMNLNTGYDVSIKSGEGQVFAYTPTTTGMYIFKTFDYVSEDYPYSCVYLYTEDGYITSYTSDSNGELLLAYEMEAGTTYYFVATTSSYTGSADYSVMLYAGKTIESISASNASSLRFGTDEYVTMVGTSITITYTDGTKSTLTLTGNYYTQDPISGQYIYYYIYDEDDDNISSGYSTLAAGTYTVKFFISGEDEAIAEVQITVVDPSAYELGDVNMDGSVTYLDAMMVLRYDAQLITLTEAQLQAGDVNGDGEVNSLDAIKILRYDAGLITSF